jgi:hypothetical protein
MFIYTGNVNTLRKLLGIMAHNEGMIKEDAESGILKWFGKTTAGWTFHWGKAT